MIWIFRTVPSNSARSLVEILGSPEYGLQVRRLRQDRLNRVKPGDKVICWGEKFAGAGVQALNGAPLQDKFADALKLKEKGIPTVEVSRTPPAVAQLVEPMWEWQDTPPLSRHDVAALIAELEQWLAANPEPEPQAQWLGRLTHHVGGNDLLNPPAQPQFYSKKENLVAEYRVHSFKNHSIRSGKKRPIDGQPNHEWIRSLDAGWRISYDGHSVRQRHRDLAHAAVAALGLDFGAVDIGERGDGSLIVLEVNRAPGIEGGTLSAYAKSIKSWVEGDEGEDAE